MTTVFQKERKIKLLGCLAILNVQAMMFLGGCSCPEVVFSDAGIDGDTDEAATCTDDTFENNDSSETANALAEGEYERLRACPGDDDYYAVHLNVTDEISVTIQLSNDEGDINIELLDPGETVVASSESSTDEESLTFTATASGRYLIHVVLFADAGADEGNGYDMNIEVVEGVSTCTDDTFEDNDSMPGATAITDHHISMSGLRICPDDDDYYSVPLNTGNEITVDLYFSHAEGNIDIELLNHLGTVVDLAESSGDNETLSYSVEDDGNHYIRVYFYAGDSGLVPGNDYDMDIDVSERYLGTYHGLLDVETFNNGVIPHHAWRNGVIAFYTWTDPISVEHATRWTTWQRECVTLYEIVTNRDAYLQFDDNFGEDVKTIIVVDADPMWCGTVAAAGCGNKVQVQTWRQSGQEMIDEPESPLHHWIIFYEMGRGAYGEAFDDRATWPPGGWGSGFPHMMAGICLHNAGGIAAMEDLATNAGLLIDRLDDWEDSGLDFAETFADGPDNAGFIAHDIIAAILMRLFQDTDIDTIEYLFREIEGKPIHGNAVDALCDFVDAVETVAGAFWANELVTRWGMPDSC